MKNDRNQRDFVSLLKLFLMILVCMFGFYGWKERVLYRQLEQKVLQEQQGKRAVGKRTADRRDSGNQDRDHDRRNREK